MKTFSETKLGQLWYDIKNFFIFRKQMKMEDSIADSKFTKFGLKRNWLGNIIYMQLNCTDDDYMNAGYDFDRMYAMKLRPVVEYLGTELGWGEYLVPQINSFVDENGDMSLSFGVLFIFTGYQLTMTKALLLILFNLGLIGTGIWALIHYLL